MVYPVSTKATLMRLTLDNNFVFKPLGIQKLCIYLGKGESPIEARERHVVDVSANLFQPHFSRAKTASSLIPLSQVCHCKF